MFLKGVRKIVEFWSPVECHRYAPIQEKTSRPWYRIDESDAVCDSCPFSGAPIDFGPRVTVDVPCNWTCCRGASRVREIGLVVGFALFMAGFSLLVLSCIIDEVFCAVRLLF